VRRCPYRQCPCENCQEHNQLLDGIRRENIKRRKIREKIMEKRMGQGLLPRDKVKLLRRQMDNRTLNNNNINRPSTSRDTDEEPNVLSYEFYDPARYMTDVEDYDDPTFIDGYLSDEVPDPEDHSNANFPFTGNSNLLSTQARWLGCSFTPPRPGVTTSTSPLSIPTPVTPVWTPTTQSTTSLSSPLLWTHSATSTNPPEEKMSFNQPDRSVFVTPSSDSDIEQTQNTWRGCGISIDNSQFCSFGAAAGIKRMLPKEVDNTDEISSIDELLNDTTDEGVNETEDTNPTEAEIERCNDIENEVEVNNNAEAVKSTLSEDEDISDLNAKNQKNDDTKCIVAENYFEDVSDASEDYFEDVSDVSKDYFEDDNDDLENLDEAYKNVRVIKDDSNDDVANNNKNNCLDAKKLVTPKKRTIRWDVPPPGLTPGQSSPPPPPPVLQVAQVPIPPHLKGLLIGIGGHFIHKLNVMSGAAVTLGPVYCTIKGGSSGVAVARRMIADRLKQRMF